MLVGASEKDSSLFLKIDWEAINGIGRILRHVKKRLPFKFYVKVETWNIVKRKKRNWSIPSSKKER